MQKQVAALIAPQLSSKIADSVLSEDVRKAADKLRFDLSVSSAPATPIGAAQSSSHTQSPDESALRSDDMHDQDLTSNGKRTLSAALGHDHDAPQGDVPVVDLSTILPAAELSSQPLLESSAPLPMNGVCLTQHVADESALAASSSSYEAELAAAGRLVNECIHLYSQVFLASFPRHTN